jgi:hypothetical protein
VTLNLSQVFVRFPSAPEAANMLQRMLAPRAKGDQETPQHVVLQTGTPWLAIVAWGNNAAPETAEYLSRALESHAIWFGLAGRALAYRLRKYQHGKRVDESVSPPELFGAPEPFTLPAYVDAESELMSKLIADGLPPEYLYVRTDELGMSPRSGEAEADAVAVLAAPWKESGLEQKPFLHRRPRHDGRTVRTLFDRFDDAKQVVADDLVLRGTWDEARGESLLRTLQAMAQRRTVPAGWKYVYILPACDIAQPLGELFAQRKGALGYELAIE